MQIGDVDEPDIYGDVGARDEISLGVSDSSSTGKINAEEASRRKPKGPEDPFLFKDELDSMIIFPGNISRSSQTSLKRVGSGRPGKSSLSEDNDDDEAYVPPQLKTLAPAAFQSLRRLIEARRRVVGIDSRDSSKSNNSSSSSYNKVLQSQAVSASQRMEHLEISRPPSCAAESGYCEEIDTYPK